MTTTHSQLLEHFEEASNLFGVGKSQQEVVLNFIARGMSLEQAENIANTGKTAHDIANEYVAKSEELLDGVLVELATDAAVSIDKGISKDQVISELMAKGFSVQLAEQIVVKGQGIYKDMTASVIAIKNGKSKQQVIEELTSRGISASFAEYIVVRGQSIYKELTRHQGKAEMLKGAGVAGVGLALSFGSYLITGEGGRYLIATGAMVIGGLMFLRGLWQQSA